MIRCVTTHTNLCRGGPYIRVGALKQELQHTALPAPPPARRAGRATTHDSTHDTDPTATADTVTRGATAGRGERGGVVVRRDPRPHVVSAWLRLRSGNRSVPATVGSQHILRTPHCHRLICRRVQHDNGDGEGAARATWPSACCYSSCPFGSIAFLNNSVCSARRRPRAQRRSVLSTRTRRELE